MTATEWLHSGCSANEVYPEHSIHLLPSGIFSAWISLRSVYHCATNTLHLKNKKNKKSCSNKRCSYQCSVLGYQDWDHTSVCGTCWFPEEFLTSQKHGAFGVILSELKLIFYSAHVISVLFNWITSATPVYRESIAVLELWYTIHFLRPITRCLNFVLTKLWEMKGVRWYCSDYIEQ